MGRSKKKDSEKFKFSDYYEIHKEELSEKKKEKYLNDAEYREKVIARARANRDFDKTRDPNDFTVGRIINGTEVKLYKLSAIALVCDVLPQSLRYYENKGWLPKHTFEGRTRYYTGKQAKMIKEFCDITAEEGFKNATAISEKVFANWG